jgi:nucleoside 2-deoxyribosyltransferase
LNHLSSYLLYNGFKESMKEYRYFTTMSKERCDEYKKNFEHGDVTHGHPVRLENENVENWYPKTFAEKVDNILLHLNSRIRHMGEYVKLPKEEMISCLFVDRYDYKDGNHKKRTDDAIQAQMNYMIKFLVDRNYILSPQSWNGGENDRPITLSPEGYARVDAIQKNTANGKNVLVAMKFGDDTKKLREMIRQGIMSAGYVAIFIDEVEHNDFITPELLKYIRDSKFVVVDLSHQNNGAYFEEGYAMGLGKPVIQLCKKDVRLHFDIAQKNTIIWETEEEIPERLKNRIIATID